MIEEMGIMIQQLRKKVFASQENLSRGLLSAAEFSRIENGEKEADSFLMSALFQRLGKSMDQFEMAVSEEEYTLVLLRAFIQESMECGDYDRTEELLDEYEDSKGSERLLHRQYAQMVRAVLQYLTDRKAEVCLEKLWVAMELTFEEEGRIDWTGYRFCIQEIQILLLIGYFEMELMQYRDAGLLLEKLYHCIDMTYTEGESKIQVYSKCCYLLAKAHLHMGKREKAMQVAESGLENLINRGSLTFMEDLLELQQACEWTPEREERLQGIRFAYQLADYSSPKEVVVRLLFAGICSDVLLSNELLREVRVAQGKTQEELCEGICARETLAKIELGRTPSRCKLQELIRKLGIDREKYCSYVITDDWDVFELVRDYKRNCFEANQDDALELLAEVEGKLDLSVPANRQFVEMAHLRHQIRKREISWDESIKQLTNILHYTMPEYQGKLYRIPYREEFIILNRMGLSLKLAGRKEEAMELYEDILQKFQLSKVKPEHHTHTMSLLYLNYFALLETYDYLERASELGKTGLELMLKYQRGDMVGMFLANLACVYEKSSTQAEKSLALPCLESSCMLLDLFRLEKKSKAVRKYLDEYYANGTPL